MKYAFLVAGAFIITTYCSCLHHHGGSLSIQFHENDNYYSMDAWFDESKTRKVQRFIDSELGDRNSFSFVNTQMDAMITLDDHTTFHMQSTPGELKIKLNKHQNSFESYTEIKDLCEGIKAVILSN